MRATDRVAGFMTENVLTIDIDDPASEVLRLFESYPVHHLPVLSGGKVAGMLSSADLMKMATLTPEGGSTLEAWLDKRVRVARLMSRPVITVRPEATLLEAARTMAGNAVHALPVVDEAERLLGIITTTDVMHAALESAPPRKAAPHASRETPPDIEMSATEFDHALAAAKAAVAAGEDVELVALGLLYLNRRLALLEQVLQSADRYLKFGHEPARQAGLRAAIAAARRASAPAEHSRTAFGLE
jgi:CBS domain-containing membrane protein